MSNPVAHSHRFSRPAFTVCIAAVVAAGTLSACDPFERPARTTQTVTTFVDSDAAAGDSAQGDQGAQEPQSTPGATANADATAKESKDKKQAAAVQLQAGGEIPLDVRKQMLSMTVPAMCLQNAGTLVNGELPASSLTNQYAVERIVGDTSNPDPDYLASQIQGGVGDFDNDGTLEYAVVFTCSGGGVGWPESIILIDQNLNVINSGENQNGLFPDEIARSPYDSFAVNPDSTIALSFKGHDLSKFEPACCPSLHYSGNYRVSGGKLVAVGTPEMWPIQN